MGEASPLWVKDRLTANLLKSYRTKPYKFPMHCSKCVSFWGASYSRPPIDPYLTSPPVTKSWQRHWYRLHFGVYCILCFVCFFLSITWRSSPPCLRPSARHTPRCAARPQIYTQLVHRVLCLFTYPLKAKFHYTGPTGLNRTRADPHGLCRRPARTQQSFSETRAAKKSVRVRSGPVGPVL